MPDNRVFEDSPNRPYRFGNDRYDLLSVPYEHRRHLRLSAEQVVIDDRNNHVLQRAPLEGARFSDLTLCLEEAPEMPRPALDPDIVAWVVDNMMLHNTPNCVDHLRHVYVCPNCGGQTDHRYPTCHQCGHRDSRSWRAVRRGDTVLVAGQCAACATDITGLTVISYAERMGKPFRFRFNNYRTFGIEIECVINEDSSRESIRDAIINEGIACYDQESYSHTGGGNRSWIMKSDSSIHGSSSRPIEGWQALEIVSPVLSGAASFDEVEKVCAILREHCTVNQTCGLHIHQGATDMSGLDLVKLYQQCYTDQAIYQHLLPQSRRNNHYCAPLRRCTNPNQIAVLHSWGGVSSSTAQVANHMASISGRASVNYNSYSIRGTIEFRMHSGTLDFEKIRNWVVFTQSLMEKARCTVQSFYRRFTENVTSSPEALSFLLFSRLGFPRSSRTLENRVAMSLIARHRELAAGARE